MADEEERAAEYRRQCKRRREFQSVLASKRKGDDYARRQLYLKTKPLRQGDAGETSND